MAHEMPRVPGVDHRFLSSGDTNFHVAFAGESGPPVLLLHGWPEHWYAWRGVIPALAEHHRVFALDLRGFGWTDIAWQGFEKERMADDVARVMELLELDRAAVVGHDWGGWIAALLAIRRPELVERLALLATPLPWAPFAGGGARRLARSFAMASPATPRLLRRSRLASLQIRRAAAAPDAIEPEAQAIYVRDLQASTRARAGALFHRTLVTRELPALIARRYRDARLEMPALLLYGERDPLVRPAAAKGAGDRAPALRVEVVPGAGHHLPEEAPAAVAAHLLAFMDSPGGT